jgi:hypothetical protein
MEGNFVNERQLSKITGISVSTLQSHRLQGKGLPYYKFGRKVMYCLSECLEEIDKTKVIPGRGNKK